jgi:hypothetical protein
VLKWRQNNGTGQVDPYSEPPIRFKAWDLICLSVSCMTKHQLTNSKTTIANRGIRSIRGDIFASNYRKRDVASRMDSQKTGAAWTKARNCPAAKPPAKRSRAGVFDQDLLAFIALCASSLCLAERTDELWTSRHLSSTRVRGDSHNVRDQSRCRSHKA